MTQYDLVIIGAGPGGYVAAEQAAKAGQQVAVIEKEAIGGSCLNVGCIPSKTYLQYAHWVNTIYQANESGIKSQVENIDFNRLYEQKNQVVQSLQNGIHSIFKANHIDYIQGEARVKEDKIYVEDREVSYRDLILATGSRPFIPSMKGLDRVDYLTTDSFFDLKEIPDHLVIIGGGVIGVEMAFAMRPLGAEVSLLEVADDILLSEDEEARAIIKAKLEAMGIDLEVKADIQEVQKDSVQTGSKTYEFDQVLLATGRQANLDLAQDLGLALTGDGRFVQVDSYYRTSQAHIYAIGDLVDSAQLAHVASQEGKCAVNHLTRQPRQAFNQKLIPRCVYTDPEIASFGFSEAEAQEAGYQTRLYRQAFASNGRALASGQTEGFVKLLVDERFGEILGGVVVGAGASEMIHQLLTLVASEATVHELAHVIVAHPTLSEVIGEMSQKIVMDRTH